MTAEEKREELQHLRGEVNHPKHELITLARRIEEISPRKARTLDSIIGRLEAWQNSL